ncbi:MAG: hypothetical protein KF838_02930 [Phycisphaeraceae bacterium]|nr:MAG: hypothetical protein KF838_02930 [Phycisphaeraceae bacterium]
MASAPPPSAPSASSSSSSPPRHSAALRVESSSSDDSLIPAHLHSPILSALCHPGSSLCSVARDFRIAVDILAMWLTEPDTREKMLAIEKGGCAHTRMAASVSLASTVGVLQTIIDDYTQARAHARQLRAQHEHLAPGASRYDPLPPSHLNAHPARSFLPGEAILGDTSLQAQRLELRRAEGARRACHHLYRLSRILPIDDSILALAHAHSVRVPHVARVPQDVGVPQIAGVPLVPAEPSEAEPVLQPQVVPVPQDVRVPLDAGVPLVPAEPSEAEPLLRPHVARVPQVVRVPLVPAEPSEAEPVLQPQVVPVPLDVRVPLVPAEPSETEPVLQAEASDSNRAASVSERTSSPSGTAVGGQSGYSASSYSSPSSSDSPLPSQPVHPAGALPNLPIAAGLKPDANSPSALKDDAASAMPPEQPTTSDPPSAPPPSPPAPVPRPHHAA